MIVYRYVALQILSGLVITTAVLLPLFSFLDLLDQLDDVGKGTYQIRDAFLYTAWLLPRRFIQLSPFIALLGTVVALGKLAAHSELNALRIAGMSPVRISLIPLGVGLVFLVVVALMEHFVAPQLQQKAIATRAVALDKSVELGRNLGIWSRDRRNVLRIGEMVHTRRAADVEIMVFDRDGLLESYIFAGNANFTASDMWELRGVTIKTMAGEQIKTVHMESMQWTSFVEPDQIPILTKSPESLSPVELFEHVRFLRATNQEANAFALALWRKAGGAITTIAMVLLSIPFVFGSVRTGLGNKLVFAAMIGIGVYLFDQIVSNVGLMLHLSPALTALAPGVLLVILANLWLRRVT